MSYSKTENQKTKQNKKTKPKQQKTTNIPKNKRTKGPKGKQKIYIHIFIYKLKNLVQMNCYI